MAHDIFVALSLLEESTLQRVIGELADRVGQLKSEWLEEDNERTCEKLWADIKSTQKVLAIARMSRRAIQLRAQT